MSAGTVAALVKALRYGSHEERKAAATLVVRAGDRGGRIDDAAWLEVGRALTGAFMDERAGVHDIYAAMTWCSAIKRAEKAGGGALPWVNDARRQMASLLPRTGEKGTRTYYMREVLCHCLRDEGVCTGEELAIDTGKLRRLQERLGGNRQE